MHVHSNALGTSLFCCFATMIASAAGCGGLPHSTVSGDVQNISISDTITPPELYAETGDEVRWVNNRDTPVLLGFLGHTEMNGASCEKGFQHLWVIQDIVTIPAHGYVSLCFSSPANIRYNVWWDVDDPRGNISRTAMIHITVQHTPR